MSFVRLENNTYHNHVYCSSYVPLVLFPSLLHLRHFFCLVKYFTKVVWRAEPNVQMSFCGDSHWQAQAFTVTPSSLSIFSVPTSFSMCDVEIHLFMKRDQGKDVSVPLHSLYLAWCLANSRHSINVSRKMRPHPVFSISIRIKCEGS